MKKFLIVLFAVFTSALCSAQNAAQLTIPADTAYRIGTLPNGMKYYIRHNAKPEGLADFYILTNVGAIQEGPNQIGLAHFLEHMAFNGTDNLPGKTIINYLESIGVRFGANLNAGTGVEATTYLIKNVPLKRQGIIDTALLILHDWADRITLDGKEIDAERGVIIEELRQGNNAGRRVWDKNRQYLYGGTKYADCNIIGTEKALRDFTYNDIRTFYHKWYRTDQQALIIVGDFDADKMVAELKARMSDIKAVENPEPKAFIKIPDNEKPIIGVITDPELTNTSVNLYVKKPVKPNDYFGTVLALRDQIIDGIASSISQERSDAITSKNDAPFLGMAYGFTIDHLTNSLAVVGSGVAARKGEVLTAFEAFYRELQKAIRYGFTQAEFDRAKQSLTAQLKDQYAKRGDRENDEFVDECLENFKYGNTLGSIEDQYQVSTAILNSLTLEDVNNFIRTAYTPDNRIILAVVAPDSTKTVPVAADFEAVMTKVEAEDIAAPVEEKVASSLMPKGIKLHGSKVKTTETGMYGSTVWTLRNGARVILKPSDYKKNEVMLSVDAGGGMSALPDSLLTAAMLFDSYCSEAGVGGYTPDQIAKITTGKIANASQGISSYESSISGYSTTSDLETMLQMMFLEFTAQNRDRDAFNRMMLNVRNAYSQMEVNPNFTFSRKLNEAMYKGNARRPFMDIAAIDKVTYEQILAVNDKLFGNANGYTFILTGDFDLTAIRPLIEKYIGSLPYDKKAARKRLDDGVRLPDSQSFTQFATQMQTPKAKVYYMYSGEYPCNTYTDVTSQALSHILSMRYLKIIREEKGGSYGVSARSSCSSFPTSEYRLIISFDTNTEMCDELRAVLPEQIKAVAENGPTQEEIETARSYMQKNRTDQVKQNSYWLGQLESYYIDNEDFATERDKAIAELSIKDVQALAKKIMDDNHETKVIMLPK